MFGLFLNLCCSKREKVEGLPNKQIEEEPPQNEAQDFDQYFNNYRTYLSNSNEYKQTEALRSSKENVEEQRNTDLFRISSVDPLFDPYYAQEPLVEQYLEPEYPKQVPGGRGQRSNSFEESSQGVKKKIRKSDEKPKRQVKLWTPEEDQLLRQYYKQYDGDWQRIACELPGRNISQCSQRWRRITPLPVKHKWTQQEDDLVKQLVVEHQRNWVLIAKHLPGRTGKQIRERYLNKLDPQLRSQPWTEEEDQAILKLYKQIGPKWSTIAAEIDGRSENMVKNRFHSYIKRVILNQVHPYQVVYRQSDDRSTSSYDPKPQSENNTFTSGTYSNQDSDIFEDPDGQLFNNNNSLYYDESNQLIH